MDKEGGVPPSPAGVYRRAAVRHQLVLAWLGEQGRSPFLGAYAGWYTFRYGLPAHIYGIGVFRLRFKVSGEWTWLTLEFNTAELHNRCLRDLRRIRQRRCLVH